MSIKQSAKRYAAPVVLWDIAWKVVAVRRAMKRKEYPWAVMLLISSTAGVLPMWYLRKHAAPETSDEVPA